LTLTYENKDKVEMSVTFQVSNNDIAFRYANKIMQPLLVTLEPTDAVAKLITHKGQEFNLVLEGTVIVTLGDKEFVMNAGDSIYFNPTIPHGQRCGGDVKARFLTVIAE
jgi:quercetin dioxygenase-like cupin family protein